MHCRHPPRLPIATGTVGIDPAGQVQVYAAPRVVHARQTFWHEWPPIYPWWWQYGHHAAAPRPCGPRPVDALAWLLTSGWPGLPPPWPPQPEPERAPA